MCVVFESIWISGKTSSAMTISWTAPFSGGLPINNYTVRVSDYLTGVVVQEITRPPILLIYQITNLRAGTDYSIRVRASNDVGTGPWSGEMSAARCWCIKTIEAKPDQMEQPRILSHTSRDFTCSFTEPDNNGESIFAYAVQWKLANAAGDVWTLASSDVSPNATNYTVVSSELQPNSAYVIRTRAINAIGSSDWSIASATITTLSEVPSRPSQPSVTAVGGHTTLLAQ